MALTQTIQVSLETAADVTLEINGYGESSSSRSGVISGMSECRDGTLSLNLSNEAKKRLRQMASFTYDVAPDGVEITKTQSLRAYVVLDSPLDVDLQVEKKALLQMVGTWVAAEAIADTIMVKGV